jgi:glycosyltransferase involved in cell wall biosynthesis
MKISIVIPAYNEERRISKTLEKYSLFFEEKKKYGINYEILVVINGSNDNTEKIVEKFKEWNSNISYMVLEIGGKGNAVIEGFKKVLRGDSDFIGFTDADNATPPEEFFKLLKYCLKTDGAIGDRYMKDSTITPRPSLSRLMAKRAFNFICRSFLLLPFRDTQCGSKIFKRYAIVNVLPNLTISEWAFDVEILYNLKKKGYQISSVPINWVDEEYSTINFWKSGPGMVLGIFRLRLLNSPFKDFIRFYNKLSKK